MTADPPGGAWRTLRALLRGERPSGPIDDAVAEAARRGGVVKLAAAAGAGLAERLTADLEARLHRDMLLELAEHEAAAALGDAGVAAVLLKGGATARLVYDRSEDRERNDVDLLVGETDFERAVAALDAAGFRRVAPNAWWAAAEASRYEQPMAFERGGAVVEIDLHRRLSVYRHLGIDHRGIIGRAHPHDGARWPLPTREDLLLHTALHAATTGWTVPLRTWIDVARLAADPALELRLALVRARQWRVPGALWAALHVAHRWLDAPPPPDALASAATRRLLATALSGDGATPVRNAALRHVARAVCLGGPAWLLEQARLRWAGAR